MTAAQALALTLADTEVEKLSGLTDPGFLREAGWDAGDQILRVPKGHALRGLASGGEVRLAGLPELVVAQMLYGLQERVRAAVTTEIRDLRRFCYLLTEQAVPSVEDLAKPVGSGVHALWRWTSVRARRAASSPETEKLKDVWDLAVLGYNGNLDFTGITQPWLREAAKIWAGEDLPHRRGKSIYSFPQACIHALAMLSTSLRLHRPDRGEVPGQLGRTDVESFLHRLAYLEQNGTISAHTRRDICRKVRLTLRRMRVLGLTRQGRPMTGLPEDFAVRDDEVPRPAKQDEPGRALPAEILKQLCEALPRLEKKQGSRLVRVAVELLIDTGRRPDEICKISWDCLEKDSDGKYVLIYDDFKNNRLGRRLPIADATAAVIIAQKKAVRDRFPDTKPSELRLLPPSFCNPHGQQGMSIRNLTATHRRWVDALSLLRAEGTEFDSAEVVPYSYRHTYAQRHADAGVPVDVLRELMGHEAITTSQIYYRIGEKRCREAVDMLASHQFDRHGNRVWKQAQALLDYEHARRKLGEVAVPYGVCREPSNVQAGGGACPFRFRCVGCDHFHTDASYLPDLKAYLQDLRRDRERVLATADLDDWAKAEAMPSQEEIRRVKDLVHRVEQHIDQLTPGERATIDEAVGVVRRARQIVNLGLPRLRPSQPDLRLERL